MKRRRTEERAVLVDGQPKGVVFRINGRWRWRRSVNGIATDSYSRRVGLAAIKAHIAFVCRGSVVEIKRVRHETERS